MFPSRSLTLAIFVMLTLACGNTASAKGKRTSDPLEISKILHAIPAVHGDLGSRLAGVGLRVISIAVDPITKADVSEDPEHWAMGDVEIQIFTEGDPQAEDCQIMGQPTLIKRHGKYLPQDRTGMWLLSGKCEVPD